MHQYSLQPVTTDAQISALSQAATEIWHEYFPYILSTAQIDYMVQRFQSEEALTDAIYNNGYHYAILLDGKQIIGYVGIKEEPERLFLSKLYLKKDFRGKGLGTELLQTVISHAQNTQKSGVYLTVNRFNDIAIHRYTKLGFKVIREQKEDIGGGFFMDDYVMQLSF